MSLWKITALTLFDFIICNDDTVHMIHHDEFLINIKDTFARTAINEH